MTDTKKEPSCLNEIPIIREIENPFIKHIDKHLKGTNQVVVCKICNAKACFMCDDKREMILVRDVQEMVIRRLLFTDEVDVLGLSIQERATLIEMFNITDAMIEEYKQKEARR